MQTSCSTTGKILQQQTSSCIRLLRPTRVQNSDSSIGFQCICSTQPRIQLELILGHREILLGPAIAHVVPLLSSYAPSLLRMHQGLAIQTLRNRPRPLVKRLRELSRRGPTDGAFCPSLGWRVLAQEGFGQRYEGCGHERSYNTYKCGARVPKLRATASEIVKRQPATKSSGTQRENLRL